MRFCGCAATSRRWPASSCSARLIGLPRNFYSSGGTVVVVQHAQALAALNLARVAEMASLWADELVRQTLVIAFTVIMGDEVLNGCPQRFLAEEDHAIQAGLLDADCGGSFTDSTPASASMPKKSAVDNGSRS